MKCPALAVVLSAALATHGAQAQSAPPPPPTRHQLAQELGLGAEQAAKLEDVLRRDRQRHEAAREQTRQEVAALKLSREQQARIERELAPPRREPRAEQRGDAPPPERDGRPAR